MPERQDQAHANCADDTNLVVPMAGRAAEVGNNAPQVSLSVIYRPVAGIFPDPGNARTHSKAQVRQIVGSIKAFGVDRGMPFPLADLAQAETILLVGSNLAETMPPVMQHFQEQKRRGGTLIVVDPRATPTTASATLHLQITPGTDVVLANGLMHMVLKKGYADEAFIAERTRDFDAVRRVATSYWPGRVERITGMASEPGVGMPFTWAGTSGKLQVQRR